MARACERGCAAGVGQGGRAPAPAPAATPELTRTPAPPAPDIAAAGIGSSEAANEAATYEDDHPSRGTPDLLAAAYAIDFPVWFDAEVKRRVDALEYLAIARIYGRSDLLRALGVEP